MIKGDAKAQNCWTPYNKRWSLTELRVLYTIAGESEKPTCQLLGLVLICQNKSQNVETKVLKTGNNERLKSSELRIIHRGFPVDENCIRCSQYASYFS